MMMGVFRIPVAPFRMMEVASHIPVGIFQPMESSSGTMETTRHSLVKTSLNGFFYQHFYLSTPVDRFWF